MPQTGAARRPESRGTPVQAGKIGPNAVIRLAEALDARCGRATTARIFAQAGLSHRLAAPPEAMVEEAEVVALHRAARAILPARLFDEVAQDAGERTARYLLEHRVPRPVQRALRLLPAALAARLLARAIAQHAWTFAGSGRFRIDHRRPLAFEIADGPLGRGLHTDAPACGYFAATFEGLFRSLIHPEARVRETACQATGAPVCRFVASWPPGLTRRPRSHGDATWRGPQLAAPPPSG